jgi:hypothetical protein
MFYYPLIIEPGSGVEAYGKNAIVFKNEQQLPTR